MSTKAPRLWNSLNKWHANIAEARIFSRGVHFFTKNLTFFKVFILYTPTLQLAPTKNFLQTLALLALPGGALAIYPYKLCPQNFFSALRGARAPSVSPGYAYLFIYLHAKYRFYSNRLSFSNSEDSPSLNNLNAHLPKSIWLNTWVRLPRRLKIGSCPRFWNADLSTGTNRGMLPPILLMINM